MRRWWGATVGVLLIFYAVNAAFRPFGDAAFEAVARFEVTLLYVLIAAGAVWGASQRREHRGAWTLIAGMVCGYTAASIAVRLLAEDPIDTAQDPAAAAVVWLLAYVLAYAGISLLVRAHVPSLGSLWLDGVAIVLALTALTTAILLPETTRLGNDELATELSLVLTGSDVVLASIALSAALLIAGPVRRQWLTVGAGFALIAVGHGGAVENSLTQGFERGAPIGAAVMAGLALLAAACLMPDAGVPTLRRSSRLGLLAAPVLCFAVATALLAYDHAIRVPAVALVCSVAALVLVAFRAVTTLRDLERVYQSRRFEASFDEATIGMALTSTDQRWLRVNEALCTMLGRQEDELLGRPVHEVLHPDDAEDGAVRRFVCPDGRIVDALVTSTVVADPFGSSERWQFTQVQDITAQRRDERQKAAIADLTRTALAATDTSTLLDRATRTVAETLGRTDCAVVRDGTVLAATNPVVGWSPADAPLCVPIRGRAGNGGDLSVRGDEFTDDEVRFVETAAGVVASALDRVAAEEELRQMGLRDTLTGLANRALLGTLLEQALRTAARHETVVGVMLLDIDRFKVVNDTLGHAAGDELLRAVAARLTGCVRDEDVVARFGGDEFVVVCGDLPSERRVADMAHRVLRAFDAPFQVDGRVERASASVGVAVACAGAGSSDELLRDADVAMYRAKERRGRFEVFDKRLRQELVERVAIEDGLRRALEEAELRLHYQPIIALGTGAPVGTEALLRWQHPERGLLGPGAFLPVAEESELIVEVGRWALREACRQVAAWSEHGGPVTRVGVNVAARQVTAGLVDEVRDALAEFGLDGGQLGLELTETSLMDPETTVPVVRDLRALGTHVALDDFGTGYSSLGYLERYDLDTVKLDKSFVQGSDEPRRAGLLRSAIEMAHALGLNVIAEGVETAEQHELLRELGCELAQGFLFARPQPADELELMLSAR